MSIEILIVELTTVLQKAKDNEHELGSLRATLLVNFGPGSLGQERYGFCISDKSASEDSTSLLLVYVLDRLTTAARRLSKIRGNLEEVVCTKEPDAGVVLLSQEGTTHKDHAGRNVYDHEHFSPLGDALIEIHRLTSL